MTSKTHLRIPITAESFLTDVIKKSIKENVCKNREIEEKTFGLVPDYPSYYKKRITSLHWSFLHLLSTVTRLDNSLTTIELTHYSNWAYELALKEKDYPAALSQFKNLLIAAINSQWTANNNAAAIGLLNDAEAFSNMDKERPDTITIIQATNGVYLLVNEIQQPCSQQSLEELHTVKNSELLITPSWFASLTPHVKKYLYESRWSTDIDDLLQKISLLLYKILTAKKNGNFNEDLQKILSGETPAAPWFESLNDYHQVLLKQCLILEYNNDLATRLENNLKEFKNVISNTNICFAELAELQKLPFWYLLFNQANQQMLHVFLLKEKQTIAAAVSSKFRQLPLLSNFALAKLMHMDNEGKMTILSAHFRASHPAPRDFADHEVKEVGQEYTRRNLQHVVETFLGKFNPSNPVFSVFSFISPLRLYWPMQTIVESVTNLPDRYLYERLQASLPLVKQQKSITIQTMNAPLNPAKYIESIDEGYNEIIKKIAEIRKLANTKINQLCDLFEKFYELNTYTELYGKNFCLGTLANIINQEINGLGSSLIICVSGKDRTAAIEMSIMAHYIYFNEFGVWPDHFEPDKRALFVEIFATSYVSEHEQVLSSQNAEGVNALKNMLEYLPADIIVAIETKESLHINFLVSSKQAVESSDKIRSLQEEDKLASTNEIKDIAETAVILPYKDEDFIVFVQILSMRPEDLSCVLTRMLSICSNKEYWKNLVFPSFNIFAESVPTAVDEMNSFLQRYAHNPSAVLAHCVISALNGLRRNSYRYQETEIFYAIFKNFSKNKDVNELNNKLLHYENKYINKLLQSSLEVSGNVGDVVVIEDYSQEVKAC